MRALRVLRMLAATVWVGGLVFFAFVMAPVAFHVAPVREAGAVVGGSLKVFDGVALGCGAVFLLAALGGMARRGRRRLEAQFVLIAGMMAATAWVQWRVIPRMDVLREQAGGDVSGVTADAPERVAFERLHRQSERVEGAVLLAGVALVVLLGLERD